MDEFHVEGGGTGSYLVPTGTGYLHVQLWGAGGGGGGAKSDVTNPSAVGGGGGGGGFAEAWILSPTESSYAYFVSLKVVHQEH